MIRLPLLVAAAALIALFTNAAPAGRGVARAQGGGITLQRLATQSPALATPNGIVSRPNDARLFLLEQGGRIKIYDGTSILPTAFLDVSGIVSTAGQEQGLLGLAFHPNYATNGLFFIDYTNTSGDVVIARYSVSANANVANTSGTPILTIPHPGQTNHNGGQLVFGPDDKLYIGVGDGGGVGDPPNNAQNLTNLLGKILRIDVDSAVPYGIPADNPFATDAVARHEIWSYGLRNPWRFSFDRGVSGDLWIGDVGQDAWEEIDYAAGGASKGANYGWRTMEATHCYNPATNCNPGGLRLPILEYPHAGGADCAVTGGYRYRGPVAGFAGTYVYGDFCTGKIWGATKTGTVWSSTVLLASGIGVSSFGEGNNGDLYVVDYYSGALYKILIDDTDGDGVPDASDNCPTIPNPGQDNVNANMIDLTGKRAFNDFTRVNSDNVGDACDPDADHDGLANVVELALGPGQPSHAACPPATAATDPLKLDTDSDHASDRAECALGFDPASAASKPPVNPANDADHDMLPDAFETSIGTNPNVADSDGDGISDGIEYIRLGSNPLSANTDGDLCGDGKEVGSINADTLVNSTDLLHVALAFGGSASSGYVFDFDVNKDGTINSSDLLLVATQYGSC